MGVAAKQRSFVQPLIATSVLVAVPVLATTVLAAIKAVVQAVEGHYYYHQPSFTILRDYQLYTRTPVTIFQNDQKPQAQLKKGSYW
jgi:hypothetical protein